VSDNGGTVPVRQHHHVRGAPRRGSGHLPQVRQRPYLDRTRRGTGRQPPRQQDLAMRRDYHPASASERVPGARGQRLGGTLIGAEPARLLDGVCPGHIPGVLPFGRRLRQLDRGGHNQI
jgi:hypothetical protein